MKTLYEKGDNVPEDPMTPYTSREMAIEQLVTDLERNGQWYPASPY
jgi:hypothetical protein